MAADVEANQARRTESVQITLVLPWGRSSGPGFVAALLGIGQLLWFAVELLRGYFWQDDYIYFYLGATRPLNLDLLMADYNGHVQPGTFLISWLLARVAPLNHPVAVVVVLALQAGILLLCWRLLVRLFGSRWAVLVPFAVVACSPVAFVMSMWWAYAMQLLPVVLALFGALDAHVAYLQRPSRWYAVRPLLFVAFGLAFWEKAVLILPVIAGITLVLADGRLFERVGRVLRTHRQLWLAYLALLAAYAVLHVVYAPLEDGPTPTAGDVATLVRNMIGDTLLPAVYGGPWSGDWVGFAGLAPPPVAVLVLTWTLSAAAVVVGVWRNRLRAVLAWVVLGGYLASSVVLLAFTRLEPYGALIGTDPRYIADALPVVAVFGALALLPLRADLAPPREADGPVEHQEPERRSVASVDRPPARVPLLLVAVLLVGSAVSIAGAVPQERHGTARSYVENVRAAYELEPDLMLYDTPVPPDMLIALFGDNAMTSRVFAPLGFPFDQPTDDLRMLDSAGQPRRIGLVDVVGHVPGPVEDCGYLVHLGNGTRIPMKARTSGERRVLEIGYYSQHGSAGTVALPEQDFKVRFEAGAHRQFLVVDGGFDELLIRSDGPVCVTDVLFGAPLPHMN